MEIIWFSNGKKYTTNLSQALDISIPLKETDSQVNCFYAPPFETAPVVAGNFIGSTKAGGPLNFLNIRLNPHGNGTHTECVGHIAKEVFTINQCLSQFHFLAQLISLYPIRTEDGDRIITKEQLVNVVKKDGPPALILRTQPNDDSKQHRNYSGTNPPYLHHEATEYLVACGIQHLLIDLPSVDRESDGGKLLSHKAFWKYPNTISAGRQNCTITELIYVPVEISDGLYLLNLQITSLEIDASPSKPVLYMLKEAGRK